MSLETPMMITFIGYLLTTLFIGYIAYKATTTLSDYILGGRQLGPAVTALSVGASDMSGWLLLGLPGAIYLSGVSEVWIGVGLVIGAILNWLLVAPRLRTFTEFANNSHTIPEFFENRFADNAHTLRFVSALTILVFFTFYVSSGLVGGAILFEKVFALDYLTALIIGAVVIVSYTFLGGFLAVSWTDFFQGCLMLLALIILPIVTINELGGLEQTNQILLNTNPDYAQLFSDFSWLGFLSLMAWGLGYFGQPHILSRFMAIRSVNDIPMSRNIAMIWMILSLLGALALGLVGIAYYANAPLANPETVFIFLSKALLNPWVAGVIIAAILSAIMSTIDSQLLVCSSVIVEDFYKHIAKQKASEKQLVWISRFALLFIAVVAMTLALDPQSSILGLVSYAWAGFGSAFGPTVLLALYWQKYNRFGAMASIISGAVVVFIWPMLNEAFAGIFAIYEMIPGFLTAAVMGILVSRVTQHKDKQSEVVFNQLMQNHIANK
ncbi:sodium/proline symporter PutP [Thalassotalea ponticola]|uniref:sodium/proline symporter PutP n=1 Tax=Thalassotalea ponticola TaxID=1523392 RepID=UPI0025B5D15D|nr:sodium/proline symporter PutP [Thalassotalea ponticola]MDN3651652.1 sodium/proline symporter PutP [Thalassotalea ponticola]